MNLGHPDARRGLRSVVQAILVMALLITVWANIERLDAEGTKYILGWCMIILLVGTAGYIMENGLRSFSFKGWGAEASANSDAPAAAEKVASDVKDAADQSVAEVKEGQ